MQTIVEPPEFQRKASTLLSVDASARIINYLAAPPTAGDIMPGTGGIRKWRWSVQGKGESGGVRVIYYFHNESMPLFFLSVFGKGEKANITKAESNDLAKLTAILVKSYGGKNT